MPDRVTPFDFRSPLDRRGVLALGAGLASSLAACRAAPHAREGSPRAAGDLEDRRAELDRLFAGLTDPARASRPGPIRPEEHAARRARLGHILAAHGYDAFLCESGASLEHLADVSWGRSERLFALVVLADGSHFWICPAFEAEKARLRVEGEGRPGGPLVTWDEDEYAWKPLAAALRERGAERVSLDPATRLFVAERLGAELGAGRVTGDPAVVRDLRAIKEPHELGLMRTASELTQRALGAVAQHVQPGMTGSEVSELVHHAQRRLGLTGTWALCLVGPAAAYPHGDNSDVTLRASDFLLVDTGGAFHGYQSDTTRTWSVGGRPGERPLRAWHAVRDAQQRAFEAVRPGVACAEIDRVARASLERAGYGTGYRHFTHRLGHGIGLEGHEAPYFDGGSAVVLEPGMTLSDEPGLYFYGEFGVRLEDVIAVTDGGADHFGSWQRGPLSPE